MGRAPCCDKANVKRGPWSPEEDAKLKAYIEEHGTVSNWIALPHKIGIKRCGKSCRLRWLNYLRPNLKHGGFSEEEDTIICNLYISIGSRWSIIAAQLPGRTDNDIKNYWNTKLKKRLLGRPRGPSETRLQESTDDANSQALSSSALERMQLHIQLQGVHSPFSFYNHPLLWPKFHPFRGMINQSQSSNDNPTLIVPFREPELPNWINENIQDQIVNNSTPNALTSPSSSTDFSTRNSNSELDSVEAWLQGELQGSLYNESSCFVGVEDFRPSEFISFDDEGGSMNTLPTDYFEERSPLHSLASDRPAI